MICVGCGTIERTSKRIGSACPSCGQALRKENQENLRLAAEAIALVRIRALVAQWSEDGLIERRSSDTILRSLELRSSTPQASEEPQSPPTPVVHQRSDAEARQQHEQHELEVRRQYEQQQYAAQQAQYAQQQQFAQQYEPEVPQPQGAVHEGIGMLAVLDAPPSQPKDPSRWETEVRPLLYENVGWFIGTLLVLAGSVYGVREAWRTLGGIARHVTVGGALFAYHAAFVGLAALLAKKSEATGRVLAVISLGLLPVVFVALSSMLQVNVVVGSMIALPFVVGAWLTTSSAARRFSLAGSALPLAMVPSLIAELPLATSAPDAWSRVAIPFVGVATLVLAGRTFAVQAAALYGAVALGVYAIVGGPDDAARGAVASAGFGLWATSIAAVVAIGSAKEATRERHPRAAPVATVLALSVALVCSFRAVSGGLARSTPRDVLLAHGATLLVSAGALALSSQRARGALHLAMIVGAGASFVLGHAFDPTQRAGALGPAVFAALAFVTARGLDEKWRGPVNAWGVVTALFALGLAPILEPVTPQRYSFTFATALVIAVSGHGAGGTRHRGLHYLAGFAALEALCAWTLPSAVDPRRTFVEITFGLALAFAVCGVFFDARRVADGEEDGRARPFEDLSAGALWLALFGELSALRIAGTFAVPRATAVRPFLAAIGLAFIVRSLRDRSAFATIVSAVVLAVAGAAASGARSPAQVALFAASAALATTLLATVRGTDVNEQEPRKSRRVFGVIPLPFAAHGLRAVTDGLARASWLGLVVTVIAVFGWMGNRVEAERSYAVLAGIVAIGTVLVTFATGAHGVYRLRGSVAALTLAGAFVGLTAVANRVGRPLPPPVVALRLSLIAIALWIFAQLARAKGPALGRVLGDEEAGKRYHAVFHAGVFILASVLVLDALIVGQTLTRGLSVAPPLMLIGPAVALVLLSRSLTSPWLLHVAAPLAFGGAALITTQQSVLGSVPGVSLAAGVTWGRALLGPAACAAAIGASTIALGTERKSWTLPLSIWVGIVTLSVFATGWFRAEVLPSALLVAAGAMLLVAGHGLIGRGVGVLGALLTLHAMAQAAPRFPWWAGPAIALVSSLTLFTPRGDDGDAPVDVQSALDVGAALGLALAFVYAVATRGVPQPEAAGPSLLQAAYDGSAGRFLTTPALPLTAAIAGVAVTVAGTRGRLFRDELLLFLGAPLLALAAASAVVHLQLGALLSAPSPSGGIANATARLLGPNIACAIAVLSVVFHGLGLGLERRGARFGRDALLAAVAIVGVVFVLSGNVTGAPRPPETALLAGFAAILFSALVAGHAAFRERSGPHVYFVELAIVATYALIRTELAANLPPEADAIFALGLGFVLLGVIVAARRANVPEIAASTRTFVALLPLGVALVLPYRPTMSAAVLAAAAGALYGALAWLEKSRLFGSLGAAACDVALLVLALANGIDGTEVYFAALGLFVLALGHVFAAAMPHGSRIAVRVIGGLLLYAPAAMRLATELGNAPNGGYSVGFGVACLLGVLVGMVMQIRAYLALGTGFLVLDVGANLTAAGIRDHRIGFLVLSLTGLAILGGMAFVTMKREWVTDVGRRLRIALRGWD